MSEENLRHLQAHREEIIAVMVSMMEDGTSPDDFAFFIHGDNPEEEHAARMIAASFLVEAMRRFAAKYGSGAQN